MQKPTTIAFAAVVVGALTATSPAAAASEWPWCADLFSEDGGGATNCGFASWQQCQTYISGIGGWCYPNPYFRSEPAPRRRDRRRR